MAWTEPRRRTYELLVAAGRPLAAYDLIALYRTGGPAPAPPTVYRALAQLTDLGLVHRLESRNTFVACTDVDHPHSPEFFICNCCGRAEEIAGDVSRFVKAEAARRGFAISHAVVEMQGLCRRCAARSVA